ncbi:single-stranded DNA-binding protein [Xylella fastidiosa]|uniref:Single-stranded DNA-binding protein 1 n=1 Tax=Xylella fastidiosa (strain 9a5c) TaxID=160492 RepID=SSB1_XYLFA|nr:single-stranded DNA-binding protein [Xylella fastidiosa]Q9PHE7.1 RecName: Full=Single-stranded DNA-binding protein 1; Short=SSB 1 [Xylella fastidiosa 9a5c]AAF85629.1 single-strand binding protein [Xylella fastidiosa 9a5c]ALQ96036.1 single-stranded DNA-binding protein [Xylella fastidiosa]ALR03272.1 single-stranded DNA-binding protein [Xylella fastidiosa]KXB10317.1 single-stranded DNA-binding protein [Xylella fastidiosa]KXB18622.1 single-stranded DNA-binding protein [Xylella fastidiosa]
MASLNKMQLIGNLGADPDIRYMQDGTPTVTVSVATTDTWKDKDTGNKEEKTEWHRVVFFGGLAEIVGEFLKKGSQIYVEGALRSRNWTDKEGNKRYTTEIMAKEMQMLGKKQDNNKVGNARHGDALPADEDDYYDF